MTRKRTSDNLEHEGAVIRVLGIGGAGSNAINRMIAAGVRGVEFIAINTDAQALTLSQAPTRIRIGKDGLGVGGDPEKGARAAEDSKDELMRAVEGADMVFITAGMGGGTGTGGSPIIAELAREIGALTVGVVTKPFSFEGKPRSRVAEEGLKKLKERVDTLIVIPNDRLLELAGAKMTLQEAFRLADDVLRQGIQGISELITVPGLINLDFADVRAIMANGGSSLMAMGSARGEGRAVKAAGQAIESPLLDIKIDGAQGVLFNVTAGPDLTLAEVNEAAGLIQRVVHPDANIIFGAVIDPAIEDELRITVVATGFDGVARRQPVPATSVGKIRPFPVPPYSADLDLPPFVREHRG